MSEQTIFSIIIPLYNREKLVVETIQSLQNQTFSNWEAIIIDDHSTDSSQAVVKKISQKDKRIKLYMRNRLPKGASSCRNIGINKSSGDYIIFLDSDDLLKPFSLEQRYKVIQEHSGFDYWVFQTVNFEDFPKNEKNVWNTLSDEDNLTRFFKLDSVWHTSGPVWKTENIKDKLFFDEQLLCWQDVDFHLQALLKNLKYKLFFHLPPDILYRRHSQGSISQGGFNKEKKKSQFYFIKKYYREVNSKEHKIILQKLYKSVLENNLKSRYFLNIFEMFCWRLFK